MEKEKRWKVGDEITFKSTSKLLNGIYKFGGSDMGGSKGKIKTYREYKSEYGCYEISVFYDGHNTYAMLECEFEEWDEKPSSLHKFKIGDEVSVDGEDCIGTIIALEEEYNYIIQCNEFNGYPIHRKDKKIIKGDVPDVMQNCRCLCEDSLSLKKSDIEIIADLIKEAQKRYPIGTKYRNAKTPDHITEVTSTKFRHLHEHYQKSTPAIMEDGSRSGLVYYDGKWAEIINEKPMLEPEFKVGDKVIPHKFISRPGCSYVPDMNKYCNVEGIIEEVDEKKCLGRVSSWWWPYTALTFVKKEEGTISLKGGIGKTEIGYADISPFQTGMNVNNSVTGTITAPLGSSSFWKSSSVWDMPKINLSYGASLSDYMFGIDPYKSSNTLHKENTIKKQQLTIIKNKKKK